MLAGISRNVNFVVYFIFKLQLKFRNENYSSVILNCKLFFVGILLVSVVRIVNPVTAV